MLPPNNRNWEMMKVRLPGGAEKHVDGEGAMVHDMLIALGLNPAGVIVSRNGRVIPEDTVLGSDDEIRVIRVSHGG